MRKTLSRRACDLIAPDAWVIDDTGFTKDGDRSPGVARQYSGTLGKVGNCQIAVSVHAASMRPRRRWAGACSCPRAGTTGPPPDPDAIAAITARRKRSAIPDTEHHRTKWEMAIEMIDELIEWGSHSAGGGRHGVRRPPATHSRSRSPTGRGTATTRRRRTRHGRAPAPIPATRSPRRRPTAAAGAHRPRAIRAGRELQGPGPGGRT
ncbi:transposase [Rhodococcus opacus]|nr:transposase [Rhodococcus opacus]